MATIPPHPRLKDVENAANFMALVQDNFEVLTINDGLAAALTLLNEMRAALVEKGMIKGGA